MVHIKRTFEIGLWICLIDFLNTKLKEFRIILQKIKAFKQGNCVLRCTLRYSELTVPIYVFTKWVTVIPGLLIQWDL